MRQLPTAVLVTAMMCGSGLTTVRAVHADALTDMLGPREIAVGEAMRAGAVGSIAVGENPSGAALNHELVFDATFGYRPDDSGEMLQLSACDSTNAAPGCFFFDHIGQNPVLPGGMGTSRSTYIAGISLSHSLSEHILFGTTIKYFHFDTDYPGEDSASGVNWDLGATVKLTDMINFAVTGYNIYGTSSVEFPRAFGGGVLVRPVPTFTMTFDSVWKTNVDGARYGGGLEWFIRSGSGQYGFPLRGGVLHDNELGATYASAGLGLASIAYGFDITGRKEVDGGNEYMIIGSLRLFGPRQ